MSLSVEDVRLWLDHLKTSREKWKRGALKASKTKEEKRKEKLKTYQLIIVLFDKINLVPILL